MSLRVLLAFHRHLAFHFHSLSVPVRVAALPQCRRVTRSIASSRAGSGALGGGGNATPPRPRHSSRATGGVVVVVAAVTAAKGKKQWWWAYECAKGDASPSVDHRIVSMSSSVLSLV